MKVHLLSADRDFDFSAEAIAEQDALVQDLELDVVFSAMSQGDPVLDQVARQVVLHGLDSPDEIRYRQSVLSDFIGNPDLVGELYTICLDSIRARKGNWGIWGRTSTNPSTILAGSVRELEMFAGFLKQLRAVAEKHSDVVGSDGLTNFFWSLQSNLTEEYFDTIEEHLRRLRFRHGVLMSAVVGPDISGRDFVLVWPNQTKTTWRQRLGLGPKRGYSFTVPPRDDAASQSLENLRSRGVNLVANAVARSADQVESYLAVLRAELAFYIGCLNLREALSLRGVPLCFPDPAPATPLQLQATALRDPSLILRSKTEVLGNDVRTGGKQLVIVTGANSGGKSTFLRSIGVAQLLMQCGCVVAAEAFRSSVCRGVFTHFIREEDSSMERGRLDDELARMSSLVDSLVPGSLLLCNESFASTNEREGSEIGRQVVRALLESGVRVVYVTHQYDFALSFTRSSETESVLFLRAERDTDGSRSFKIAEHEPQPTSYGADLYAKVFSE